MKLLLFPLWIAASVLFVAWRARVLRRRDEHPDMLDDDLSRLFVWATALLALVLMMG